MTGGGTDFLEGTPEVRQCDMEVQMHAFSDEVLQKMKVFLEGLGTPKGSKIIVNENEILVGTYEGLGLYLNCRDLLDNVYEECDPTYVYEELNRLTEGVGKVYSYMESEETAFYLYGTSFDEMKERIKHFVNTYPLLQKSRMEKIA